LLLVRRLVPLCSTFEPCHAGPCLTDIDGDWVKRHRRQLAWPQV
jgi:hypothetical protein